MTIEVIRTDRSKIFFYAFLAGALILMPILGCLGGGWYGLAWSSGAAIGWKPLEPLPQKANKILAAGTGLSNYSWVIYVETTNQKIYSCSPDACWIEKTEVPEDLRANPPCDNPANFEVPSPPGQVVDSIEAQACHPEAAYQVNFAVLEDGSVWRWQNFATGLSLLAKLFASAICGSILGLFGGLMIAVFILRRNKGKKDHNLK